MNHCTSTPRTTLLSNQALVLGDVGHPVPMQIGEDADQAGRSPSFNATTQQAVPEEVPPVPKTEKLTVVRSLSLQYSSSKRLTPVL